MELTILGHPLGSPAVRGSVGGQPAFFILDTGAGVHALARWIVTAESLQATEAPDAHVGDLAGNRASVQVLAAPPISVLGWGELAAQPAIVAPFPTFFEDAGVAGVLSPQRMAQPGVVTVLDMPARRISQIPEEDAEGALGVGGAIPGGSARICSTTGIGLSDVKFTVPVQIDGEKATLLIDTGAMVSSVGANSAAGRGLAQRAQAGNTTVLMATGDKPSHPMMLRKAHLTVGEVAAELDVQLDEGSGLPQCAADGVLGMDVLAHCRLAVSSDFFAGRCGLSAR